jgi:glycosyltransferase involved in cell wall biosynthesis
MKILVLHSRYLSGQTSGENRVVEDETQLLRDAGHDVRVWTPSPTEFSPFGLARIGGQAVWSLAAVSEVRQLVRSLRADVVHCHNLFPMLSPAVLSASAGEGAAVVVTLHNYRFMCLPSTFVREGFVCEDCLGRLPWRGVRHRCYRNSLLASSALAASLTLHRTLGTFDRVHSYLAVSSFLREKYVRAGFPSGRISLKPNFVNAARQREGPGDYFLFLGRLSGEKGLATLVEVARRTPVRVVVAGDGPDRDLFRNAPSTLEYRGNLGGDELAPLLAGARALLVPSRWYEGAPRVVLEAYAAGVPVVASRIGALPELVEEGESGLLADPDDVLAWGRALERLCDDAESERMGAHARHLWKERYSPERGLENLEEAYRLSLTTNGDSREVAPDPGADAA